MGTPKSKEMKKGPWTRDEDQKLLAYIKEHGQGSWRTLPEKAGLERCGKSCRLRWTNYLRPGIKRGKWAVIAAHLPNRTDNEIKNYWNTRLKKRLIRMGIDPTTHKPKNNQAGSHMAQWETARVEAEARLASAQFATAPPTSALNFSGNNLTVCSVKENEENGCIDMKGKMENMIYPSSYAGDMMMMIGSLDHHNSMNNDPVGPVLGEYEEINNWNDLLNLVNSSRPRCKGNLRK